MFGVNMQKMLITTNISLDIKNWTLVTKIVIFP